MPACSACGLPSEATWAYCAGCGAALAGGPAPRLHLDDLLYNCQRCGKEARYGELPRCAVCRDPMCAECVVPCASCSRPACRGDLLECHACRKVGCLDCFAPCETCEVHAVCPDHEVACADCGYLTCATCLDACGKCGLDICPVCLPAHKEAKR